MHSYTVTFAIAAPPHEVWRVLHRRAPKDSALPPVIEYPAGTIERETGETTPDRASSEPAIRGPRSAVTVS
jgi:hypothetical protein